jgi:hypothetical protein
MAFVTYCVVSFNILYIIRVQKKCIPIPMENIFHISSCSFPDMPAEIVKHIFIKILPHWKVSARLSGQGQDHIPLNSVNSTGS